MNRIKIYIIAGAIAIFAGAGHADQGDDGRALSNSYPIQIYMAACVVGLGEEKVVASQAKVMGFKEAPGEKSEQYLRGNEGKAWYAKNEHGEFGIASLKNGSCSIFIHQGNPETLQASMESWLPPENTRFSYTKELVSNSGHLTTTAYKIFRGDSLMEKWSIMVSSEPGSKLVAIMSYETPQISDK